MPNKLNEMIAKELSARYPKGTEYLVLGFAKLTSPETTEMRKTLRESNVAFEVVKNSLASRVFEANGIAAGNRFLQGPCAIAISPSGMPEMCKIVTEIAKKYENRVFVRGGCMGDMVLTPETVVQLASIPPMPVLQAKFIGSVQAPVTRVAGAFQSIVRSLACALEGIRKQKESSGPAAAPQPPASDPVPVPAA